MSITKQTFLFLRIAYHSQRSDPNSSNRPPHNQRRIILTRGLNHRTHIKEDNRNRQRPLPRNHIRHLWIEQTSNEAAQNQHSGHEARVEAVAVSVVVSFWVLGLELWHYEDEGDDALVCGMLENGGIEGCLGG